MIPLRDNVPRTTWPWITAALIVANCIVFVRELSLNPVQRNVMIESYALIPARTTAFLAGLPVPAGRALLPFFTSMFLHGGWIHLLGNMWFLWIFGDNVEDRIGHLRYLFLYLCCGLAGALTYVYFSFQSSVPSLGASGAIAGVMGAYLITFPRARVLTLVPIFFFLTTIEIPAFLILIYWLLLQLLNGVASIAVSDQWANQASGGVAWMAHVGGFLAGVPLMLLLRRPRRPRTSTWA
jgi:membrane associated rhomboid family serine protease